MTTGLPIVACLALAWLAVILGHRHHRRETANRRGVVNHIAGLRSVAPMDEGWLNRREREGNDE